MICLRGASGGEAEVVLVKDLDGGEAGFMPRLWPNCQINC